MAVLHDYKCPVHGYFESFEAVCPSGCTDVQLVFLQPVGMKSDSTKHNDKTKTKHETNHNTQNKARDGVESIGIELYIAMLRRMAYTGIIEVILSTEKVAHSQYLK